MRGLDSTGKDYRIASEKERNDGSNASPTNLAQGIEASRGHDDRVVFGGFRRGLSGPYRLQFFVLATRGSVRQNICPALVGKIPGTSMYLPRLLL